MTWLDTGAKKRAQAGVIAIPDAEPAPVEKPAPCLTWLSRGQRAIITYLYERTADITRCGDRFTHADLDAYGVAWDAPRWRSASGGGVSAQTLHRAVVRLEQRGLIERTSARPSGKKTHLRLTDLGSSTAEAILAGSLAASARELAVARKQVEKIVRKSGAKGAKSAQEGHAVPVSPISDDTFNGYGARTRQEQDFSDDGVNQNSPKPADDAVPPEPDYELGFG